MTKEVGSLDHKPHASGNSNRKPEEDESNPHAAAQSTTGHQEPSPTELAAVEAAAEVGHPREAYEAHQTQHDGDLELLKAAHQTELDRQRREFETTIKDLQKRPTPEEWEKKCGEVAALQDLTHSLENEKVQLENELWDEQARAASLQEDIEKQEQLIDQFHSNAINLLAQDVSTGLPDDEIRRKFRAFFESEDFVGWCMEFRADQISDKDVAELLVKKGILAHDDNIPGHLRLDIHGGTGALVLLQAALARSLCNKFLTDPFFLRPGLSTQLTLDMDLMTEARNDFLVSWRIHTSEFLEAAFPPSPQFFRDPAKDFATTYASLIKPLDDIGHAELASLFERFGTLALQLWRRKSSIRVQGLEDGSLRLFNSRAGDVEAHGTVHLEAGSTRLDGRPVHVLVRPRIVSEPVIEGGHQAETIVWSSAVVWVSNSGEGGS
ncbi:hypothetical protein ACJ41O_006027 [Fusarium nematophilum]